MEEGSTARVVRGGSWNNNERVNLRSANRNNDDPRNRNDNNGFRVVLVGGGGKARQSLRELDRSRVGKGPARSEPKKTRSLRVCRTEFIVWAMSLASASRAAQWRGGSLAKNARGGLKNGRRSGEEGVFLKETSGVALFCSVLLCFAWFRPSSPSDAGCGVVSGCRPGR